MTLSIGLPQLFELCAKYGPHVWTSGDLASLPSISQVSCVLKTMLTHRYPTWYLFLKQPYFFWNSNSNNMILTKSVRRLGLKLHLRLQRLLVANSLVLCRLSLSMLILKHKRARMSYLMCLLNLTLPTVELSPPHKLQALSLWSC